MIVASASYNAPTPASSNNSNLPFYGREDGTLHGMVRGNRGPRDGGDCLGGVGGPAPGNSRLRMATSNTNSYDSYATTIRQPASVQNCQKENFRRNLCTIGTELPTKVGTLPSAASTASTTTVTGTGTTTTTTNQDTMREVRPPITVETEPTIDQNKGEESCIQRNNFHVSSSNSGKQAFDHSELVIDTAGSMLTPDHLPEAAANSPAASSSTTVPLTPTSENAKVEQKRIQTSTPTQSDHTQTTAVITTTTAATTQQQAHGNDAVPTTPRTQPTSLKSSLKSSSSRTQKRTAKVPNPPTPRRVQGLWNITTSGSTTATNETLSPFDHCHNPTLSNILSFLPSLDTIRFGLTSKRHHFVCNQLPENWNVVDVTTLLDHLHQHYTAKQQLVTTKSTTKKNKDPVLEQTSATLLKILEPHASSITHFTVRNIQNKLSAHVWLPPTLPNLQHLHFDQFLDLTDTHIHVFFLSCSMAKKRAPLPLQSLRLEQCPSLTQTLLSSVARHCPYLQTLSIRDCPHLHTIAPLQNMLLLSAPKLPTAFPKGIETQSTNTMSSLFGPPPNNANSVPPKKPSLNGMFAPPPIEQAAPNNTALNGLFGAPPISNPKSTPNNTVSSLGGLFAAPPTKQAPKTSSNTVSSLDGLFARPSTEPPKSNNTTTSLNGLFASPSTDTPSKTLNNNANSLNGLFARPSTEPTTPDNTANSLNGLFASTSIETPSKTPHNTENSLNGLFARPTAEQEATAPNKSLNGLFSRPSTETPTPNNTASSLNGLFAHPASEHDKPKTPAAAASSLGGLFGPQKSQQHNLETPPPSVQKLGTGGIKTIRQNSLESLFAPPGMSPTRTTATTNNTPGTAIAKKTRMKKPFAPSMPSMQPPPSAVPAQGLQHLDFVGTGITSTQFLDCLTRATGGNGDRFLHLKSLKLTGNSWDNTTWKQFMALVHEDLEQLELEYNQEEHENDSNNAFARRLLQAKPTSKKLTTATVLASMPKLSHLKVLNLKGHPSIDQEEIKKQLHANNDKHSS